MTKSDLLHLAESTFLVFAIIFSFFVIIPISYSSKEYNYNCLLFAQLIQTNPDSNKYSIGQWGYGALCKFNVGLNVVTLVWSVVILVCTSYHQIRGSKWRWVHAVIVMAGHVMFFILTLVSVLIIVFGFKAWCQLIVKMDNRNRCQEVMVIMYHHKDYSDFYVQYTMAIIGSLSSCVSYFFLVITSICRLCSYDRRERRIRKIGKRQPWEKQHIQYQRL